MNCFFLKISLPKSIKLLNVGYSFNYGQIEVIIGFKTKIQDKNACKMALSKEENDNITVKTNYYSDVLKNFKSLYHPIHKLSVSVKVDKIIIIKQIRK